jgi:hypothetical protein
VPSYSPLGRPSLWQKWIGGNAHSSVFFTTTFDAAPPAVALSPTEAPRPGAWLAYLTDVHSSSRRH